MKLPLPAIPSTLMGLLMTAATGAAFTLGVKAATKIWETAGLDPKKEEPTTTPASPSPAQEI